MGYWYHRWDWGEAIAFDALDEAARAFKLPFLFDFVSHTINEWMEQSCLGSISRHGPWRSALLRYTTSGDEKYLAFAKRMGDHLLALKKHPRGAFLLDGNRPFAAVDSHYGEPAFLLELAEVTADTRYAEQAIAIAVNHSRLLQSESGLYRHFIDLASGESPECHWGRGNGWATLGLSDILIRASDDIDGVRELRERFVALCNALEKHENPAGGWRNLVDQPASYPESSTTAFVVAGLIQAVTTGILPDRFQVIANRGWAAIEHRIDTYGSLVGVSYRPGTNTDISRYEHVPTIGSGPWGQGSYIIAAVRMQTGQTKS
jgi:rhamnogalacturonyl hydrolase YesR